ncbi:carboxypeptidase-like regulatory domain-containing protein [Maioricimonas sp. JC845]|uniref:carboxypeptidase-like regulatory domain-containing protein n=1 Tax=Maioricimonas sp. JC845 TaxID=3232138 RepID=UPI003458B84A
MRWSCVALAIVAAGCSSSPDGPELVPYTGVIQLDGQPLADAVVTFHPNENGLNGATGQTNADGEFTLVTGKRSGIVPGSYKVTVSRFVKKDGSAVSAEEGMDIEQLRMTGDANESVPPQYSELDKTTLTADVSEAPDSPPKFELTSS